MADTAVSDVDGERGHLVIAGSDVEELARTASFEEAAARVLAAGAAGALADPAKPATAVGPSTALASPAAFAERIGRARAEAWELRRGSATRSIAPTAWTRCARRSRTSARPRHGGATAADLAGDLDAAIGAIGRARARRRLGRRRAGRPPIAPDPSLGHAADYLRMTTGQRRARRRRRAERVPRDRDRSRA